mmetsp:Transcript_142197/g.261944  ORF Transcript_142197/g.261944 Transcript_142197/m.261944 type:complete len:251 (-) Transcript_142197:587-1339(-)
MQVFEIDFRELCYCLFPASSLEVQQLNLFEVYLRALWHCFFLTLSLLHAKLAQIIIAAPAAQQSLCSVDYFAAAIAHKAIKFCHEDLKAMAAGTLCCSFLLLLLCRGGICRSLLHCGILCGGGILRRSILGRSILRCGFCIGVGFRLLRGGLLRYGLLGYGLLRDGLLCGSLLCLSIIHRGILRYGLCCYGAGCRLRDNSLQLRHHVRHARGFGWALHGHRCLCLGFLHRSQDSTFLCLPCACCHFLKKT